MKTILVPTDFSRNANTALLYAADLAARLRAQLILLHVFQKTTYWYETPTEIRQKENLLRTESLRNLEELENSPALVGKRLKIITEVRNGKVAGEIAKLVRERQVDMIVMGNKGGTLRAEGFDRTLTSEVVEKTSCPVLVIPDGIGYQPIRNIVSAIDYHDSDLLHTIELTELATLFQADITLLHISGQPSCETVDVYPLDQLRTKACTHTHYKNVYTQLIEGENVVSQIDRYAEKNATDLLAMASKKRSVLENVSGPSFTKQMIFRTKTPLLIYKAFDLQALYVAQ